MAAANGEERTGSGSAHFHNAIGSCFTAKNLMWWHPSPPLGWYGCMKVRVLLEPKVCFICVAESTSLRFQSESTLCTSPPSAEHCPGSSIAPSARGSHYSVGWMQLGCGEIVCFSWVGAGVENTWELIHHPAGCEHDCCTLLPFPAWVCYFWSGPPSSLPAASAHPLSTLPTRTFLLFLQVPLRYRARGARPKCSKHHGEPPLLLGRPRDAGVCVSFLCC
jgi:hypothetical protein